MAEIVLDANVLVGYFDSRDTQHARASNLIAKLEADGHESVLLDVLVAEAVSVLCRKAVQRKTSPPDRSGVLARVRHWHAQVTLHRRSSIFRDCSAMCSMSSQRPAVC